MGSRFFINCKKTHFINNNITDDDEKIIFISFIYYANRV